MCACTSVCDSFLCIYKQDPILCIVGFKEHVVTIYLNEFLDTLGQSILAHYALLVQCIW